MSQIKRWLRLTKRKGSVAASSVAEGNIPRHVAVIMDGNGRWAQSRGLPRVAGHHAGMRNVREIAMAANRLGVQVLTLYAFSTENWKRPKEEVDFLMKLPQEFFPKMIDELIANNVQVRMMGYREGIPETTLQTVEKAVERTRGNDGMILNFALNYGSRKEMCDAVRHLAADVRSGELDPEQIDDELFSSYLLSADLPDPDLLIRTSGEVRISNFMLWQCAYSELWFTDVYWPDFTETHFLEAVAKYQNRNRRFGGI